MKHITVSVPDDVLRRAKVRAAEQGRSVTALIADFLRGLADQDTEFARLEALQRKVQSEIAAFRGGDHYDRASVHDRAVH
jgi:hypothetical protein